MSEANRFGQILLPGAEESFLPAVSDIPLGSPLVFRYRTASRARVVGAVQSFVLRSLASLPPGRLRCRFIDPVGVGSSVEAFAVLGDADRLLVGSSTALDGRAIEKLIGELYERVEHVSRTILRGTHPTLVSYNRDAEEPEPYHALVAFDFPAQFSSTTAERLLGLARSGGRCGVFVVVAMNSDLPIPQGVDLAALADVNTVVDIDVDSVRWRLSDELTVDVELDTPPIAGRFSSILRHVARNAQASSGRSVSFDKVAPVRDQWWKGSALDGVTAAVGLMEGGGLATVGVDASTRAHIAVAGKIGSGKTNVLHALICGLALSYPPTELEMYLLDLKEGVSFAPYAAHRLPHARVIAVGSDREYALSVLRAVDAKFEERGRTLRSARMDPTAPTIRSPRTLVVIDEFQELLGGDDAIAAQAARYLDRIVRKGREFGIHVVLASQSLSGSSRLALSTIGQISVRIALECTDIDSTMILGERNTAASELTRPGEAIINEHNGRVEGNRRVQFAHLPGDRLEELLSGLDQLAASNATDSPRPVVFIGDEPPAMSDNAELNTLIEESTPINGHPTVWIGEPLALAPPVGLTLRPEAGTNLAILGTDEQAALGILIATLISLLAQPSGGAPITLVAATDSDIPGSAVLDLVAGRATGRLVQRRAQDFEALLEELANQVDQPDGPQQPPRALVIHGLQRIRFTRLENEYSSVSADSPAGRLGRILRDGPAHGIHTLLWCDTWSNLTRSVPKTGIGGLGFRTALYLPSEDANGFLGNRDASLLGLDRALLRDETTGRLLKFRPYPVPQASWIARSLERLEHLPEEKAEVSK